MEFPFYRYSDHCYIIKYLLVEWKTFEKTWGIHTGRINGMRLCLDGYEPSGEPPPSCLFVSLPLDNRGEANSTAIILADIVIVTSTISKEEEEERI